MILQKIVSNHASGALKLVSLLSGNYKKVQPLVTQGV
jgi:hypothetical protein